MGEKLEKLAIDFTAKYWLRMLKPWKLSLTLAFTALTLLAVPAMRKVAGEA